MKFMGIFLMLFNLACSSQVRRADPLGPAGGATDDIPDEFPGEESQGQSLFENQTSQYGLENVKAYNFNVVDLNGDSYSDIVVIPSFYSYPQYYYYNPSLKKFEKKPAPFKNPVKASYMMFYDLNKDNVVDAIAGVLNQKTELSKEPLRIFYGKKKEGHIQFGKPKNLNITLANSTLGLIDYDLDGRLDLFVGNWFKMIDGNPFPAPDFLYANTPKGFINKSELLREEQKQDPTQTMYLNATPTYASQVCDVDLNGYPDIITTSTNRFENKLWMNRYQFRSKKRFFENQGKASGISADAEGLINKQGGGRTFGVACADYNNDGIVDIFLGELTHNYDSSDVDKSSILTGRTFKYPPKFFRTEYFLDSFDPNWHEADRRGIWADLNNDGRLDLIVDNSGYPPHSKLIVFQQLYDKSFENKAEAYGLDIVNPISTVVLDVNNDGKLDILTAQSQIRDETINPRVHLFVNRLDTSDKKSVRFYLRGTTANAHGLNATVALRIKKAGVVHHRTQQVNYSYGALPPQNEEGVHFGVNADEEVEAVIVRWPYSSQPNGARTVMEKVYRFSIELQQHTNITLCQNGNYLLGRRDCL